MTPQEKHRKLMEKVGLIQSGDTAILPTGEIVSRDTPGAMPYDSPQTGLIHSYCASVRRERFQSVHHIYEVGDFVQAIFGPPEYPGTVEHMWIEIQSVDEQSVTGRLDNDPVALPTLKWNDIVTVPKSSIEQHRVRPSNESN